MGYEALKDLPLEDVEVETPIEKCMTPQIAGKNFAIVPILRAGLGMVSGLQALVPTAKIGHIGLYRDEETHEPHEYYCKLPSPISERLIVVTDPMPETLWHCRVKEFGPLIVSIDTEGRNLFEENKVVFNERKEKAIEEICKHVSFIK